MKSMKSWQESSAGDFEEFFKPGDIVSQDVVDYYKNILPPIINSNSVMQAGGAIDTVNGRDTFITFVKRDGKWMYIGDCYVREIVQPKIKNIKQKI